MLAEINGNQIKINLDEKSATDCDIYKYSYTLTQDMQLSFSDNPENKTFLLEIKQDSTGNHSLTSTAQLVNADLKTLNEINKSPNTATTLTFIKEGSKFNYWVS